jgi:choloylglycine hydrolase
MLIRSFLIGLVSLVACSIACTYVELRYQSNILAARSMEFPAPVVMAEDWRVVSHPAHITEAEAQEKLGFGNYERIDWYESNPIGFISIDGVFRSQNKNRLDILHILSGDGINEFGLTVSTHTFVSAKYQPFKFEKRNVAFMYFLPWALGNFKSTDDLINSLRHNVSVFDPLEGDNQIKYHWAVTDSFGKSYVIEYVNGELNAWDNTQVGVMTNDPVWQWHILNLNTYATVSPKWSDAGAQLAINSPVGRVPQVLSNGYNLFGLPGDMTPQSRFVRMWYMKEILLYNKKHNISDVSEAIVIGTALLNAVFIPKGSLASELQNEYNENLVRDQDFTQYNVLKLPVEKEFIFRSYENMQWKRIRLSDIDFGIGAKSISMPVYDGTLGIQEANQYLH